MRTRGYICRAFAASRGRIGSEAGEMRGNRELVRFGRFTLDRAQRLLTRDGVPVHLMPKAFELLSVLIAAAPRVLTKADLHGELWRDSFVSDATLTGLVKELRRALQDEDRAWPIIRTGHRVGYAFCPSTDEESAGGIVNRCYREV